ncbi:glycosyltransferase [Weissella cibaria]|uniref:glycosyltransferase n=1 Tax=Weissella cibaria TaxID=137591 RepID=UPI0013DAF954|nr:glycosyltransferase [Weissella cibaria]NFA02558.1 glycosyltransferase [Weissella cibaria]
MRFENLSIVVPVYNAEKHINNILINLAKIPDVAVIMVDDGSNDDTVFKIEQFISNNRLLKWRLIKPGHRGASGARNVGISEVKTKYVMFVDADDEIDIDAFLNLENLLYKDFDFLSIGQVHVNEFTDNLSDEYRKTLIFSMLGLKSFEKLDSINTKLSCPGPVSKVYSVDMLNEHSIHFPEEVVHGEDLLFNAAVVSKAKSIMFSSESIYLYYNNVESVSKAIRYDVVKNHFNFMDILLSICECNELISQKDKSAIKLICEINDNTALILQNSKATMIPFYTSDANFRLVKRRKIIHLLLLKCGMKSIIKKIVLNNRNAHYETSNSLREVQRY